MSVPRWPNALATVVATLLATSGLRAQRCEASGFDTPTYRRLVGERFAGALITRSGSTIGSSGTLQVAEGKANLSASVVREDRSIVTLSASGGASNGIVSLFRNSRVSTDIGADLNFHKLRGRSKLRYDVRTRAAFCAESLAAEAAFNGRKAEIAGGWDEAQKQRRILTLADSIGKLEAAAGAATGPARVLLGIEVTKTKLLQAAAQHAVVPGKEEADIDAENQRDARLEKAGQALVTTGADLSWWSLGVGVKSSGFWLLDRSRPVPEQVSKKTAARPVIRLEYSSYSKGNFSSRFWTVGAAYARDNNLGALARREVKEVESLSDGPTEREVVRTFVAYEGEYRAAIDRLSLYGDYFWFLPTATTTAVHGFVALKEDDADTKSWTTDPGAGLLVAVPGPQSTRVYAELFAVVEDAFDRVSESRLKERVSIGLRISFPIAVTAR